MVAVAWTAIGLLAATLLGSLYWLGSRIDALGGRLDGRIDALSSRIDALVKEVARQGTLLEVHLERHTG
jgi:hypothetical protein